MVDEFYTRAHQLMKQDELFATAVVVRAEKPTSARPGDKAIVTADGIMHGWIGGSCAQPTVITESLRAMADGRPRLIRLSVDPGAEPARDGLIDLPLTCFSGGTLEIYIEPLRPLPHLLVVGALPVARGLVQLGQAMNYRLTVVDPDGAGHWDAAVTLLTRLEDMREHLTPRTFVVVATHGNYDEVALAWALPSPAVYVGLVASRTRRRAVVEYLAAQGLSEDDIGRLRCPAGLDIGAARGDEIALSIMAEIVQRRRQVREIDMDQFFEKVDSTAVTHEHSHSLQPAEYGGVASDIAIDPVCQMKVNTTSAVFTSEYHGRLYYFCGAGCKAAFDRDPERFKA